MYGPSSPPLGKRDAINLGGIERCFTRISIRGVPGAASALREGREPLRSRLVDKTAALPSDRLLSPGCDYLNDDVGLREPGRVRCTIFTCEFPSMSSSWSSCLVAPVHTCVRRRQLNNEGCSSGPVSWKNCRLQDGESQNTTGPWRAIENGLTTTRQDSNSA